MDYNFDIPPEDEKLGEDAEKKDATPDVEDNEQTSQDPGEQHNSSEKDHKNVPVASKLDETQRFEISFDGEDGLNDLLDSLNREENKSKDAEQVEDNSSDDAGSDLDEGQFKDLLDDLSDEKDVHDTNKEAQDISSDEVAEDTVQGKPQNENNEEITIPGNQTMEKQTNDELLEIVGSTIQNNLMFSDGEKAESDEHTEEPIIDDSTSIFHLDKDGIDEEKPDIEVSTMSEIKFDSDDTEDKSVESEADEKSQTEDSNIEMPLIDILQQDKEGKPEEVQKPEISEPGTDKDETEEDSSDEEVEQSEDVEEKDETFSGEKEESFFDVFHDTIKVLLIDNDQEDHRLIQETLQEAREDFDVLSLERLPADIEKLAGMGIDVVLLDLFLEEIEGLATFSLVRKKLPDLPIIIITDRNDEKLAFQTVQSGAQDYIVKDYINANMLSRVIRYAIERNRVTAELEKTRLAQLQMKDQFLSHVSHELRTPLTSVYQFITILLDGLAGELNDEQKEYLEITLRNVVQLKTMINDLLEVTRAQTARLTINPECISAYEVVSDAINTLKASARSKGINLSAEFPPELPAVFADPLRIRAILINLIDNAIKFTTVGGAITIRANVFEYDQSFLRISVSDTGVGIAPEEVDKIFEYLYQAESTLESSRKGLGLGLYICKTVVQLHGGQIWAASKLGVGSTFSLTLPVYHGDDDL